MDSIHKLLNLLLPLASILAIVAFAFPFLIFKTGVSILRRSVFREDVRGKVILVTGASSGIGEYLCYEYAKRGAYLVLVARRSDKLKAVASHARQLGSPDAIIQVADVSKVEDCKRSVEAAVNHFGRLDHLVNNAGVAPVLKFEGLPIADNLVETMNTNFWGSVYCTQFAIRHLRKSKGKIVAVASVAAWMPVPRLSIYSASKGALISFYESLRTEVCPDIGITIVTPGLIQSDIMESGFQSKAKLDMVPIKSTQGCAKEIFNSICRGDKYVIEPAWARPVYFLTILCPEVAEICSRWLCN